MKRKTRDVRLVLPDKSRSSRMPLIKPPPGKNVMPTRADEPSALESAVFGNLDADKLSDLAEVLFALNNHQHGPIPGFYVVVMTKPNEEWCIGQLCADREKPLILLEDELYKSSKEAQIAAEKLKSSQPSDTALASSALYQY